MYNKYPRSRSVFCQLVILAAFFEGGVCGQHNAYIKRSTAELSSAYDYVILGGGTSGLTVADRLTEDPSTTVLVVELGYFADDPCIFMPSRGNTGTVCPQYHFNITTAPQPELENATISPWRIGAVVGGSSAVNGMFFDRGTRADYDLWAEFGNPGWDWNGLFPYFKKSVTFQPPSAEATKEYGFTWDTSVYGNGPILATMPPFQWPETKIMWNAWDDLGITGPKEGAGGDAIGRFWVPASQSATNQTRSYARTGHYDPVKQRSNYHLLIGHKADTVELSAKGNLEAKGAVIHPRDSPANTFTVKAKREVILATGAVHTPQLLQRSGVGPASLLQKAGIAVRRDLPGVGQNLQDHSLFIIFCNYTKDFQPNPDWLNSNATYAAEKLAEYFANKTGPYTYPLSTVGIFLPLSTIYSKWTDFVSRVKGQNASTYLPKGIDATLIKGFTKQKDLLAKVFASDNIPAFETAFGGACSRGNVNLKPLSRGSINIDPSNPNGDPVVDFRAFSNPLDLELNTVMVRYTRLFNEAPTLAQLGPVELIPGSNVTTDADIAQYLRNGVLPSTFHPCGTAAMMPVELGGVVGSDLLVHGVRNLRIIDASIMPIIPSAHLSATVYAIAEKAADIIKAAKHG